MSELSKKSEQTDVNDKLELDNETKEQLKHSKQLQNNRSFVKNSLLVETVFNKIDNRVKSKYYKLYDCEQDKLKEYIGEYIFNLSYTLESTYNKEGDALKFLKKYKIFKRNLKLQKKRWITLSNNYIKKNDVCINNYKKDNFSELDYDKFIIKLKELLTDWENSYSLMIDFPLFDYMTNPRSQNSAFNYDIGIVIFPIFYQSINENLIYRQMDALVGVFSPYTRTLPKYEIDRTTNNLILPSRDISEEFQSQEQISLFEKPNIFDISQDELGELQYLLDANNTNILNNKLVTILKRNKIIVQHFDNYDLDIISYTLNHMDSNFYTTQKIRVVEKDILEYLGKDPNQSVYRKWLHTRFNKLVEKSICFIRNESEEGEETLKSKTYSVFDSVDLNITGKNMLKSIDVVVSKTIFQNILREDTINVYKKDFLSIKNSQYPSAIVLIYNLQLLRFSTYQLDEDSINLDSAYFIDLIEIKEKSRKKQNTIIQEYLNQFVNNKVILQDYEYIPHQQIWKLHFINLTKTDLNLLVNSRKDYTLSSKKYTALTKNKR